MVILIKNSEGQILGYCKNQSDANLVLNIKPEFTTEAINQIEVNPSDFAPNIVKTFWDEVHKLDPNCHSGYVASAFLDELGSVVISDLSDEPDEFHGDESWMTQFEGKKPFNLLTEIVSRPFIGKSLDFKVFPVPLKKAWESIVSQELWQCDWTDENGDPHFGFDVETQLTPGRKLYISLEDDYEFDTV